MSNLRRHKTVSDLSTKNGSDDQENVDLSVPSSDISDPRIFMISEAISRSLQSSFKGLETTIENLSKDIHRLASASSSKHALRADDGNSPQSVAYSSSKLANSRANVRISTYTPKSARLRAGVVDSPPIHADSLAGVSPAPSTASEGGSPMGVVDSSRE